MAANTGGPLMHPMFFDHPDDDEVWSRPQQWLLGNDVLVSSGEELGSVFTP